MVRALAIVAVLAPALAHADPATWVSNDEVFIETHSWWYWGAGLAIRRDLGHHVELGLEGQAFRVDANADDDPRHGFALRAAVTLEAPAARTTWSGIDWRLSPQIGAASMLLVGLDRRSATEVFAGVRASFRKVLDHEPSGRIGAAHAIGAHIAFRIARTDGELSGSFMIGYDWGL